MMQQTVASLPAASCCPRHVARSGVVAAAGFGRQRRTQPVRRRQRSATAGAGEGFGVPKQGGNTAKGKVPNLDAAQAPQLQATDVLARLVEAEDVEAVARTNAASLSEEFFMVADTYLKMAQKEGEKDVEKRLTEVLRACMDAKNATLRPEIRLLNQLLGCEGDAIKRKQLLNTRANGEALSSDDGYFFKILQSVTDDVTRQPDNPQKERLLGWLADIKSDAQVRQQPK